METRSYLAGTLALLLVSPGVMASTLLYSNDFESGSTANFSYGSIQSSQYYDGANHVPDNREHFLGYIWGQTVNGVSPSTASTVLTLNSVAPYSSITLSFDLYALDSLDGDSTSYGPDTFGVLANGTTTLLNATFSNYDGSAWWQAAPTQSYPVAGSPGQTGAYATNTLGYNFANSTDASYDFSFTILNTADIVTFEFFFLSLIQDAGYLEDEKFGLDNVSVTGELAAVPLPGALVLLAIGAPLLTLGGYRKARYVA
jgi:hypothetical protein